jgi:phenylacetic acid degradation operon negative regulatory protein
LKADPPRAKSLIVTVWELEHRQHGGAVWLAGLIRLMAPFGMNERLVLTSVFRLSQDGWLAATTHGRTSRYRLTQEGKRRFDDAYRRIYTRPEDDWDGTWELVLADTVPPARRAALRDELVWSGFGALGPAVFLRPKQGPRAFPGVVDAPGVASTLFGTRDLPGRRPLAAASPEAWDLRHPRR